MLSALKPVGRTPICSAQELRWIDPIWCFGHVPSCFWQDAANRRNFLLWLAGKIGFRWMEDFYRLTAWDIKAHRGSGVFSRHWHSSLVTAIKDVFREYEWCEWLFAVVPNGFCHRLENRQRYLRWLGTRLGFRRPRDWYGLRYDDLREHAGGGLLSVYGTAIDVLRDTLPELDWRPGRGARNCPGVRRAPRGPCPLARRRPRRWGTLPRLTVGQILAWADAFHEQTGQWPGKRGSGSVPGAPAETWLTIEHALQTGKRGLRGHSTLARLLAKYRSVPIGPARPVSIAQILHWADAHHRRTGQWPRLDSGPVAGAARENWKAIDAALREGIRGLPRGFSLSRLLTQHRGVPSGRVRPPITIQQILRWADEHHRRTGRWPQRTSGAVLGTDGETWTAIDAALHEGLRGLRGGTTLPRLLQKRRGVPTHHVRSPLSIAQILQWADEHQQRTGKWPMRPSGPVPGTAGLIWSAVDNALRDGRGGLPSGSSLARLLAQHRGVVTRRFPQRRGL